ncbi:unnamed protein product [Cochlearia groenlandica]
MDENREESEFLGDFREPIKESDETETLGGDYDDETIVYAPDSSGVCYVSESHENTDNGIEGSANEDDVEEEIGEIETKDVVDETLSYDDDDVTEPEAERNVIDCDVDDEENVVEELEVSELSKDVNDETSKDSESDGTAEKEEIVVDGEEDKDGACEAEHDQEKEPAKESEEDNTKHGKEDNEEANQVIHSEYAQDPEESAQLSKEEMDEEKPGTVSDSTCQEDIANVNQIEENGEAMEIDYTAEEQVEDDVIEGGVLDTTGNESADASLAQTDDVPIAEADRKDSINEMEIDEQKETINMATNLTGTGSAKPDILSEDAATGEVEPLDNALFDPGSDIASFIDFSGVSCWSGNMQDLKTERNVSSKEEVATVDSKATLESVDATTVDSSLGAKGIGNKSSETGVTFGTITLAVATESKREASDQQDAMRVKGESTVEAPSIEPNQKEDTEMEDNPNSFDYADDVTDPVLKTNGVKRKADVLSEDSPGEGRKSVSLAKVSFAQRPSFKIGACVARAASQMAGSPSVLKGTSFSGESLSVESFVSQLRCAATDPVGDKVVSEITVGFFLDFRNSLASQQFIPDMVSRKRGRPSNPNGGGTEAFEFEESGDTYWTDRVIHNGGEEQGPTTEKGNYQIAPVELKPAQVQRTRRPYRRRQSQISVPPSSASNKPANFDENAPAEIIMTFSETDTIPSEKNLSKMLGHFGTLKESLTEVDKENNRARVVYRKGADAEVAYNSAGRFNIFGTMTVKYELSYTITETFKVQPYVVSLGEVETALSLPS